MYLAILVLHHLDTTGDVQRDTTGNLAVAVNLDNVCRTSHTGFVLANPTKELKVPKVGVRELVSRSEVAGCLAAQRSKAGGGLRLGVLVLVHI